MKFCTDCGNAAVNGACATCTSKSTGGLNFEDLSKSLDLLENVSKGVRPGPAKEGEKDKKTVKELVDAVAELVKKYGQHGEGDTKESPSTTKDVESVTKKGGFAPPPPQEEEEEEFDPKRREEEEEEEEAMRKPEPEFKSAKSKKAKKSFADALTESSESVSKAIDISDYLRDFVNAVSESHDQLSSRVEKSIHNQRSQTDFNVALAGSMKQLGSMLKSLTERVESFGAQPVGQRKSDVTVVEKSFKGDIQHGQPLKKSDIAAKLMTLMESGDKSIQPSDIISAESTGFVRPELKDKLGIPAA